jgi:hypothetical protein
MTNEGIEFQLELENEGGEGYTTITVRLEKDARGRVKLTGVGDEAGKKTEYRVNFVIKEKRGGDHCWWCYDEPCPPNRSRWVTPCPLP